MDVTFFYGNKRIMTSALDKKGNRILGSEAGERVVNQVIKGKKPFFSTNVSLDGTRNYGYFIPVYQNGTTDQVIGMVFVGTNKARKDAIVNKILGSIMMALLVVMLLCIVTAMRMAASISKNIKNSVAVVGKLADGDLNVWVDEKLLKRKHVSRNHDIKGCHEVRNPGYFRKCKAAAFNVTDSGYGSRQHQWNNVTGTAGGQPCSG